MIKQFNFYDIYGYLLPGTVLLGLLWIPIGIASNSWPEQDLSKALFLAALSYIAGHLIQAVAQNAVPSNVMWDADSKKWKFPSERLLDTSEITLSEDFKSRLSDQVKKEFGIDLLVSANSAGSISRNRRTAFFQARSSLLARKTAQYVEQFQGLYAMMRGLACAFLVGAAYLGGWWVGTSPFAWLWCVLFFVAITAGILAIASSVVMLLNSLNRALSGAKWKHGSARTLASSLLVGFFSVGFWAAVRRPDAFWKNAPSYTNALLGLSAGAALLAALVCFSSYRFFAVEFARSVWQDFSVSLALRDTKSSGAKDPSNDDAEED